ncbi:NAD(P)/FAD-dependent oxidoreductase [Pseudarthrobacter sp. L19]|uniref:NAD(P)/FAD-dependent oxidoreductase n=1 Tax=Pseudarthrobacter sp. L19 TaxID=3423951 RepID=UPI003D78EC99
MAAQRVLILGAGYAGVVAANRLAGRSPAFRVTVVNPAADFIERIRLHQVAAGTRASAAVPLGSLLNPAVDLVRDSAVRIDPALRLVHLAGSPAPLAYDALLYAVGSGHAPAAPGTGDDAGTGDGAGHCFGVQDAPSAARLRSRLRSLAPGSTVSVVGAGLTGLELVTEIAESHRHRHLRLRLVTRGVVGGDLTPSGARAVRARLARFGVEVVENTDVRSCDESTLTTSGGAVLPSACTVRAAGFSVPPLARDSGLPTDAHGRLLVDSSLSCPDHPGIFGAGDAVKVAGPEGLHLRMSCASALPLGAQAADGIAAHLDGGGPSPVSAGYVLRCVSLGRGAGLIQPVTAGDHPRGPVLRGPLAALAKEQVCRMTVSWLRTESRRPGSFTWPRGPKTALPEPAAGVR